MSHTNEIIIYIKGRQRRLLPPPREQHRRNHTTILERSHRHRLDNKFSMSKYSPLSMNERQIISGLASGNRLRLI
ncbi:hypothetical protein GHT06_009587 [Daphnia sinensis]|uniref:Uncharacterized protein n=1 Tax=Daphnia sinensis TaxID=1820382 RepID=A0AAD5L6E6_9CRUS|nr:hypothetical protein GHT06_009587 [Daphnia sinensis]